jgi:hypothetical protein
MRSYIKGSILQWNIKADVGELDSRRTSSVRADKLAGEPVLYPPYADVSRNLVYRSLPQARRSFAPAREARWGRL